MKHVAGKWCVIEMPPGWVVCLVENTVKGWADRFTYFESLDLATFEMNRRAAHDSARHSPVLTRAELPGWLSLCPQCCLRQIEVEEALTCPHGSHADKK